MHCEGVVEVGDPHQFPPDPEKLNKRGMGNLEWDLVPTVATPRL